MLWCDAVKEQSVVLVERIDAGLIVRPADCFPLLSSRCGNV